MNDRHFLMISNPFLARRSISTLVENANESVITLACVSDSTHH